MKITTVFREISRAFLSPIASGPWKLFREWYFSVPGLQRSTTGTSTFWCRISCRAVLSLVDGSRDAFKTLNCDSAFRLSAARNIPRQSLCYFVSESDNDRSCVTPADQYGALHRYRLSLIWVWLSPTYPCVGSPTESVDPTVAVIVDIGGFLS
jgi:hypothetical protein